MRTLGGFNCVHPLGPFESITAKLAQYNTDKIETDYSHNLSCKETFSWKEFSYL